MTPQELQDRIEMLQGMILPVPEGIDQRIIDLVNERNAFHQSEILFFQNKLDELNGSNDISTH